MTFKVIQKIRGKARPRLGKYGAYKVKEDRNDERRIKEAYLSSGGELLEGYIKINIDMYFKLNKNETKKSRDLKIKNILRPNKRPDIDNSIKLYLDALNKVAYKDDTQVVEISAKKMYANTDEDYTIITIEQI